MGTDLTVREPAHFALPSGEGGSGAAGRSPPETGGQILFVRAAGSRKWVCTLPTAQYEFESRVLCVEACSECSKHTRLSFCSGSLNNKRRDAETGNGSD